MPPAYLDNVFVVEVDNVQGFSLRIVLVSSRTVGQLDRFKNHVVCSRAVHLKETQQPTIGKDSILELSLAQFAMVCPP